MALVSNTVSLLNYFYSNCVVCSSSLPTDNSSNVGISCMYGRTGGNQSHTPPTDHKIKSRYKSSYTSDALNWTYERAATSPVQIDQVSHVNLSRSQVLHEASSVPNETQPDFFSCAHDTIAGDSNHLKVNTSLVASTEDVTRGCRESEIITDGKRCPRTLSDPRGSSEASITLRDKIPVLAPPPTCTSITVGLGWEYAGTSFANVVYKSSNSSNAKWSQLPNFDGNNVCTSVSSSCVRSHIDSKCNDRNDPVNSKATEKQKMCRRNESNSAANSKKERTKDGGVSKLRAKRIQPKSPRACSAIGSNQDSQMTGSILFNSGIKMQYRKILPKPLNVTVEKPADPNIESLDQNPIQEVDFKQSFKIKDEMNQEGVLLAPRDETTIESVHLDSRKQNKFEKSIKLSRPKDEVFASIKRFIRETDDPKQSTQGQPTEKYKKFSNEDTNCTTRWDGKEDLKIRGPPICKTFGLKEDKSAAISICEKQKYKVLITRGTDWDILPIKHKSPVPNLVSIFSLQPEVNLREKNDTNGSSDESLGDMDFLMEGCDSPMWFSSGSSGAASPPCASNTGMLLKSKT
ncbi:hypothetical protein KP79_PYT07332 [Mizuhopecten yessoensis]|uniref:Uncharacterized protein n=1 Tax=Mizuhopecten yessoensis TaxID=6573 RepID=A0A210QB22_MIZYE|nr:hypothetical protein KP79_PYT07332 [Mizuhopecten yessoensis]